MSSKKHKINFAWNVPCNERYSLPFRQALLDNGSWIMCGEPKRLYTKDELLELINIANETISLYEENDITTKDIDEANELLSSKRYTGRFFESWGKNKNSSNWTNIYIIRNHERGEVKVGKSKNPRDRLNTLQSASSSYLSLVCFFPAKESDETKIQRILMKHGLHINKEWFIDCPYTIQLVEQYFKKR